MRTLLMLVAALTLASAPAIAKNCTVGCPCGNTCIDCGDTCHVDGGEMSDTAVYVLLGVAGALLIGGIAWLAIVNASPKSTENTRPKGVAPLDVRPLDGGAMVTTGFEF